MTLFQLMFQMQQRFPKTSLNPVPDDAATDFFTDGKTDSVVFRSVWAVIKDDIP
jgi:hypothetical protein